MSLIDIFDEEKVCEYKGNTYSVRDNGAVMRHPQEGKKPRPLDNQWTFGTLSVEKGYRLISSEPVHRIVATAFLGDAPTKSHVVDHIDTNRQNNRPTNLRWVTRLENIILNDITRTKIEKLCGCSIDKVLSNMSILHNIQLTPQFEWMKTVTKEEAENSLKTWNKWVEDVKTRREIDKNINMYFKYKNGPKAMIYPLEPIGENNTLEEYLDNLKVKKIFCYKDYGTGRAIYKILDYHLNKDNNTLYVATRGDSGIKSLFLTEVQLKNNEFVYDTRSFFQEEGLEKYMTIARGEEWTGGDVFDDFC